MAYQENMTIHEMHAHYGSDIHCPFCGHNPEAKMLDGGQFDPCKHTLLFAHTEFWLYLSEDAEKVLKANGIYCERIEPDIAFTKSDDEDVDYDDVFDAIKIPDVICFNRIVGPPAMEASWVAFAPKS